MKVNSVSLIPAESRDSLTNPIMLWNSPALKSIDFKSNVSLSINKVPSSAAKIRVQWAGQKDSKLTVLRLSALRIHLAFKSRHKCFTPQQSVWRQIQQIQPPLHLISHHTLLIFTKCSTMVSPSHRVNDLWKRSFFSYLAHCSHITNDFVAFSSCFGSTGMTYLCCVRLVASSVWIQQFVPTTNFCLFPFIMLMLLLSTEAWPVSQFYQTTEQNIETHLQTGRDRLDL